MKRWPGELHLDVETVLASSRVYRLWKIMAGLWPAY